MKKIFTLITSALLFAGATQAQERYIDEVFDEVEVTSGVVYGMNATVIAYSVFNEAIPENLVMDIYEPVGDTEAARPVVLYFHTGNFLPHPQNQSATGTRTDSAAVEICTRLAKMGYVAISCDYRLGWNPIAEDQDERVFTLINAAYRGVQDCRTAIRYLRKSTTEDGNPYAIDDSRIAVWGQGTGGYIAYAANTIDQYEDIVLDKFIREVEEAPGVFVPVPMVIEEVNGDIYGTSVGINPLDGDTLCYINHPGYSSDFNVMINMGGACGDISWVDPSDGPMISFQVPTDPFAPYTTGTVIVPGLNLPVVEVSGAYDVQQLALAYNLNISFQVAEEWVPGLPYSDAANMNNTGYYGLFPFVRPTGMENDSAPWEWWSSTNPNNMNGLATNPDMSETKAMTFIDSIQGYAAPRMACALGLNAGPCFVSVDELEVAEFRLYPNPANSNLTMSSSAIISRYAIYDMTGRLVLSENNVNAKQANIDIAELSNGIYNVEIFTDQGSVIERLVKH